MPGASAPTVGLDIGTSAVRAAQVTSSRAGLKLVSFGQAALPQGAVVDGEIRDSGAVSQAISQLWKRVKIRSKKVILGIANQRVVVRQIELPFLEEKEFRASLQFQVADHIPMPVDSAELDYQIIDDYSDKDGQRMMRVLLVAAASEMVESFVETASAAGMSPAGVDLAPFAIARAVSPNARGESGAAGAEAVVDVGATVTNIVVHHNGEPRFVRILLVGGDDATASLAKDLDVPFEEAEAMKLDLAHGVGTEEMKNLISGRVDNLVNEIRGSVDYYLSQENSESISSVVVTGGGSLTPGFTERLGQVLHSDISRGAALVDMNTKKSGLTDEQVAEVEPVAAAAVGLARA
ncbi:MAG: type IV pilus assembly protein PilM [Actinomycetota bacterium]|nr:type IV pilus assembly protein PilM [Actinomycetota bacterium]